MRSTWIAAVALALGACSSPSEADLFYASCASVEDCPTGWLCPDPAEMGRGTVGDVCIPECVNDEQCQEVSGMLAAFCSNNNYCLIACNHAIDCPETQPICRGDNPTCEGQPISRPLYCATEDFSCL